MHAGVRPGQAGHLDLQALVKRRRGCMIAEPLFCLNHRRTGIKLKRGQICQTSPSKRFKFLVGILGHVSQNRPALHQPSPNMCDTTLQQQLSQGPGLVAHHIDHPYCRQNRPALHQPSPRMCETTLQQQFSQGPGLVAHCIDLACCRQNRPSLRGSVLK